MTTLQDGAAGADRRAQIESTLAHYPNLSDERLGELIHWFRKEASALDVAMVASNAEIAEPYRRFRAEHIDPLTGKDVVRAIIFASLVSMVILVIVWRSL
jgi:hypothetical protein